MTRLPGWLWLTLAITVAAVTVVAVTRPAGETTAPEVIPTESAAPVTAPTPRVDDPRAVSADPVPDPPTTRAATSMTRETAVPTTTIDLPARQSGTSVRHHPAPTTAAATSGSSDVLPATAPGVPAVLSEPPSPPRLVPQPSDFASPEQVAAVYFAAWCYQPLDKPANQNIANAKKWVTARGYRADKGHAVGDAEWQPQVASGLTPMCGPVSAVISPDAPAHGNVRWVVISARRAYVDLGGVIVGQQQISRTRRILQDTDGRWLVDIEVQAG